MFIVRYFEREEIKAEAPSPDIFSRGVQIIIQEHPDVGWHTQSGYDFYVWRDSRWVGVDHAGVADYLESLGIARFNIGYMHEVLHNGKWTTVDTFGVYAFIVKNENILLGRTLTQAKFNTILKLALEDLGRAKLGWLAGEKKPDG